MMVEIKRGELEMAKMKELAETKTDLEPAGTDLTNFLEEAKADAGRGVSTAATDNIVPLIYILHYQSPQVDETSSAYIEGARPGMIWLRNYTGGPLISGDEGIYFQPCYFHKEWIEWVPKTAGGGFVARHDCKYATEKDVKHWQGVSEGDEVPVVDDARFEVDPTNRQKIWKRMNGNELRLTRNHAGLVVVDPVFEKTKALPNDLPEVVEFKKEHKKELRGYSNLLPYNIGLTGTGHGISKNWMYAITRKIHPITAQPLPSFACLYHLRTRPRSNAKGKWFVFDVQEAGLATAAYRVGKQLNLAFSSGEKVVETMSEGGGEQQPAEDRQGDEIPF